MKRSLIGARRTHSVKSVIYRAAWSLGYNILFRTSPVIFFEWRSLLLRIYGSKIGEGVHVYPDVKIWDPRNLRMDDRSCLGRKVSVYNIGYVSIGRDAVISQLSHLCTASHNIDCPSFALMKNSIIIGKGCWVAADAFIGPGVRMANYSVAGARSVVFKNTDAYGVYVGNPAEMIRKRSVVSSS